MVFIGCFFLYPAFWLVLFPGFWLANRSEMATSDWSDVLGVDWLDTSQSFYHPIIGCPDVTGSIRILCTIDLREHIQYIQSTCIHYAVFKHSWYDSVVYCYTVHLEMNSSHINIYIYSKATFLDTWEFWRTNIFSNKVFNKQNWKSECSDIYFFFSRYNGWSSSFLSFESLVYWYHVVSLLWLDVLLINVYMFCIERWKESFIIKPPFRYLWHCKLFTLMELSVFKSIYYRNMYFLIY